MSYIGFGINREIERPDLSLVERFKGIPVANIADNMNRMNVLEPGIKCLGSTPMAGVAFTVKAPDGDNLMFHKALDLAKPGDIIVVSSISGAERALCGEIMMRYARSLGLAGFVLDGYIRDIDGVSELGFPVYARGVTALGPYKNGPGEINVPVAVGRQVIMPGDILVGDSDGVVVIRPEDAEGVLEKALRHNAGEEVSMRDIAEGRGLPRAWVDEFLTVKGCPV